MKELNKDKNYFWSKKYDIFIYCIFIYFFKYFNIKNKISIKIIYLINKYNIFI